VLRYVKVFAPSFSPKAETQGYVMPIVKLLTIMALFFPMFVGAKWRQRLQSTWTLRYSRSQRIGIGCLGYLGMITAAIALGLFGFYQHLGVLVPVFVFLLSSANWLFGTILLGAFRSLPK